jgi:hypothetical protein
LTIFGVDEKLKHVFINAKGKTTMTKKNFLAVMGCAVMAGALLAGCGSTSGSGVYTLREFQAASPTNWNPHTWEMSNDTYIPGYCEMGFVDLAKKSRQS